MFNPNNWFMNESNIDFYLSTNTFSNPMFDDSQVGQNNQLHEQEKGASLMAPSIKQAKPVGRSDNKKSKEPKHNKATTSTKTTTTTTTTSAPDGQRQQMWSNLCDNLLFSVKNKMYVLELSFKSKLRRFKRYASGFHLPSWWLFSSTTREPGISTNFGYSAVGNNKHSRRASAKFTGADNFTSNFASNPPQCGGGFGFVSRHRRVGDVISDQGFWKDIEPNSRDSLSHQEEKILSRLELVVQAKRSNQLRLQQLQEQFGDKLLNMSTKGGGGGGGVGLLRPANLIQALENPSAHKSKSSSSWSSSSSCCSSSSSSSSSSSTSSSSCSSLGSATAAQGFGACMARDTDKKVCIVCYSNPPNIVTLPCKHHDICSDCFIEIIYLSVKQSKYPLKCVLCRQKIERIKCSKGLFISVLPS